VLIPAKGFRTAKQVAFAGLIALAAAVLFASPAAAQMGTDEFRELARLRRTTSPFSMSLKLSREFRGVPKQETRYEVDCDPPAGKWRFRNLAEGSCCLSDGEVLMANDGKDSAVLTTFDNPHGGFGFDPRLTGITTFLSPSIPFEKRLDLISVESIRHVETTNNSGARTVHLCVIDQHEQEIHYWVQPDHGHRVSRVEFTVYLKEKNEELYTDRLTSTFSDEIPIPWLPSRVEMTETDSEGVRMSFVMDVSDVRLKKSIPGETFSTSGLGLRIGQPFSDIRVKRRIGYWTGTGLSEDLPPVPKKK